MSSPAKALAELLTNDGYDELQVSYSMEPHETDLPDEPQFSTQITLINRSGLGDLHTHDNQVTYRPRLQVLVRTRDMTNLYTEAKLVRDILNGYNFSIGGLRFLAVQSVGGFVDLPMDSLDRRGVSFNFNIQYREL